MAYLFKQTYTRDIPEGAEIIEKNDKTLVRFVGKGGQLRTGELVENSGQQRLRSESPYWSIGYTDAFGHHRIKSTGTRDKQLAQQIMAELTKQVDEDRSGHVSPRQRKIANHRETSLSEHFED